MARPGVEYKEVERVSHNLIAQGLTPSVQKVREALGKGSNTTINNHLKVWRKSFSASHSPVLPKSVPDDLMNPLDEFWSTAMAKAETNYLQFKVELEEKLTEADLAKNKAISDLETKLGEIDTLKQDLSIKQAKLHDTEQQLHTLEGKYSALTNELNFAHTEMERSFSLLEEQNNAFNSEREQLNNSHKTDIDYERERSTATENRLLNEIDELRQAVNSLETSKQQQQKEIHDYQESSQQRELALQQKQTTLIAENKHLKIENDQHKEDAKISKQQIVHLQQQVSKSLDNVQAISHVQEDTKNNEIILTNSIGELKDTITHLQSITRGEVDEYTK